MYFIRTKKFYLEENKFRRTHPKVKTVGTLKLRNGFTLIVNRVEKTARWISKVVLRLSFHLTDTLLHRVNTLPPFLNPRSEHIRLKIDGETMKN